MTFDVHSDGFGVRVVVTEFSKNNDGDVFITAECVTEQEFEYAVDQLILNLKKLQWTAGKKYFRNNLFRDSARLPNDRTP